MAASVVLLGDPRLRVVSAAVPDVAESRFVSERRTLEATLEKVPSRRKLQVDIKRGHEDVLLGSSAAWPHRRLTLA
jgi:hypothetical protein